MAKFKSILQLVSSFTLTTVSSMDLEFLGISRCLTDCKQTWKENQNQNEA